MKTLTIILVILIVFLPCDGKMEKIPEISPILKKEFIVQIKKDDDIVRKIIENNSELIFITLNGKIFRMNPEKKMLTFLYNLAINIDPKIIDQKNIVILKKKDSNYFIIFNLQEMKVIKVLENLKTDKIISIDHEIISYLYKNQLIFFHYISDRILKKINIDANTVFYNNEKIRDINETLILSSSNLIIFNKGNNSIKTVKLKNKACSGFLLDGNNIYYGSEKRYLVKYSLTSNRVKWKFKVAEQLKLKPQKVGPYIAITPEDNNIYFFNKRGTLHWWEKLNSTRLFPPVTMKENIAVFLWNKTVKFFDYKKRKVIRFPFDNPVYSNFVCINGYIYGISQEETGENWEDWQPKSITRIGNNYGVKIQTAPEHIIPKGKSIKFNIRKLNLIKPELKVKIFNQGGESVFETTIPYKKAPTFVWIPDEAVEYKIVVEINSKNKKGLRIEKTLNVIDIERILKLYYYRLQKQSNADQVMTHHTEIKENEKTNKIPGREKD